MRPTQTRHLSPRAIAASLAVLTGCVALATPTLAQQRVSNPGDGRTPGMRYLTWPGKNERPRAAPAVATPAPMPEDRAETYEQPADRGPILSMPSRPLVAPVATRYSARTSPGPTPASAWISNGGAPTYGAPAYGAPAYGAPTYAPAPYDARVATLPEPPRGYAPVIPLDTSTPRAERRPEAPVREAPAYEAPAYAAPRYEAPRDEPPPYEAPAYETPPRNEIPVAADTGPATERPWPTPVERVAEQPAPIPTEVETAPVESAPSMPAVDPYAPRADAPIFRLLNRNAAPAPAPAPEPVAPQGQSATETPPEPAPTARSAPPTPQATTQAAPQPYPAPAADVDRSPRRYSVHRANGQSPDRIPLPDPVLLDSAPVDLAEPPETPTVVRNVNGRLTAITPASEDPAQP